MPRMGNHRLKKTGQFNISENVINSCFDKKFKYSKTSAWKLPPSTDDLFTENYNIPYLQELRKKLNDVKSKLNDYPIEEWSLHTGRRNPAGNIAGYLKNRTKAEFVTQAWCKFYECLHQYPIVTKPKLCSVHLCEAPGAFIAALNHYLHSTYENVEWEWLAATLNPYYEGNALSKMVADDRFMLHTLDRWMFGTDFTGNIINKWNIIDMAHRSEQLGKIDLVTADGSIDCMENPDNQEEIVFMLHYAEVCAALTILSEGGTLVIKTFTIFESSSVSLMYLLNCIFTEVDVYKPATSKCGNSETYVICQGFCKNAENFGKVYEAMLNRLDNQVHLPLFPEKLIPKDFLDQHIACVQLFMNRQITVIESNIKAYEKRNPHDIKFCQTLRNIVCDEYLKRYQIHQIPIEKTILFDRQATVHYEFHKKIYTGSYTARTLEKFMSTDEKVEIIRKQLKELQEQITWPYECVREILENDDKLITITLYLGNPIAEVFSSLFAHLHLMHLRRKIISLGIEINALCGPKSCCTIISTRTNKTAEINCPENGIHYQDEVDFFKLIILKCLEVEATRLTFNNILLLTHYSVSLIRYIWSNVFCTLIVSKDREIIFEHLRCDGLDKLRLLLHNLHVPNLLCFVNIKELHKNVFSETITNYNNTVLLSLCLEKLNDIIN